jgi:hypothetical protein
MKPTDRTTKNPASVSGSGVQDLAIWSAVYDARVRSGYGEPVIIIACDVRVLEIRQPSPTASGAAFLMMAYARRIARLQTPSLYRRPLL